MYSEPDPSSPLGRLSLRAKRVPVAIRVPLLLVAFAAVAGCAALDLPPYSLFAGAQAAILHGEHYPMLSVALTAIAILVPVGLTIQLLAGLFPDNTPPDPFGGQPPLPPNAGPPPAYMQSGPYAQGPYGQPPNNAPPYGQGPGGAPPRR